MKLKISILLILTVLLAGTACLKPEVVYVVNREAEDPVLKNATAILVDHLSSTFPSLQFKTADAIIAKNRCIVLEISDSDIPGNKEGFTVSGTGNRLILTGKTPRAVLNAVYGFLERVGYGFCLSVKTVPAVQKKFNFEDYNFSDTPLAEDRIIFNWHNFLSGCSAWNIGEWKEWIDNASAMRFNTIMVHAYGNNPMFSWSFNGIQKKTSPMPATQGGRDYGTQQVNDVRRLVGGEVFDDPVFGSVIAKMDPELQPAAVQEMMKEVFSCAKGLGMKVCFAFDMDTYPANPQELICTLPPSARFTIPLEPNEYAGRYKNSITLANPDTPEGYLYYKAQLLALLNLYPDIDQVALWMRKAGSEWLSLKEDQLPGEWKNEFRKVKASHPELSGFEDAPGRFALGRVVVAFQRALKEAGKDDIVLKAGSWEFGWMEPTNFLFPSEIGFIGLDYNIIRGVSDVDNPGIQHLLKETSCTREVTPVFWAHHDDGAYMGRPYAPVDSLPEKLGKVNASGYGIIHWTTWPLDPFFKNMSCQVWEGSRNESYRTTTGKMAAGLFGLKQADQTAAYLYEWATSAPMMGRETREWFIDHEFTDQETDDVAKGCDHRLNMLEAIKPEVLSENGRKYLAYFKGFEAFCRDFFLTEKAYQQSLKFFATGDFTKADEAVRKCNPEKLIKKFAEFSSGKGITTGERGLILTLNTEWATYIENLKQALGINPLRYKFGSTIHPAFGQGLLRSNFFADQDHHLWRVLGSKETGAKEVLGEQDVPVSERDSIPSSFPELFHTGILCDTTLRIELKPFMSDLKPSGILKNLIPDRIRPGEYQLEIFLSPDMREQKKETSLQLLVHRGSGQIPLISEYLHLNLPSVSEKMNLGKSFSFSVGDSCQVFVDVIPVKNRAFLEGLMLKKIK